MTRAATFRLAAAAFAAVAASGVGAASNAELAYHPALAKARPAASGIDASTFIPGHPARGVSVGTPVAATSSQLAVAAARARPGSPARGEPTTTR